MTGLKIKGRLKKLFVTAMATMMLLQTMTGTAFAATADGTDYVTVNSNERNPIPKAYVVADEINNLGTFAKNSKNYFKNPQDIDIDRNNNLYIADTGNNRIVVLDTNYDVIVVITEADGLPFEAPEGVFVDDSGDIYVADTGNRRIVHLANDGTYIETFVNPTDELVANDAFNPSKLVVSETGLIYVVRGENIMAIDGNNGFRGLFGQTDIGYNLVEVLIRMFASDEQKKFVTRRTASAYVNVDLGDDGLIYATSVERTEGEIKVLNSIGNNIYRKYTNVGDSFVNPITSFINNKLLKAVVAGTSFKFGEYFDDEGNYIEPNFVDITVDSNGIVTVAEQDGGKIYQYDQNGNMLCAFGGLGESKGTFSRPSSIAVNSNGIIYVVDRLSNNIQIFEPTDFIKTVHAATTAYENGSYDEAFDLWNEVLSMDENYTLAHAGIANAYFKMGEYELAMESAMNANDRDIYTKAFDEYKYEVMQKHFFLIIVIVIVVIVLVYLFLKYSFRAAKKATWNYISDKTKKMSIGQGILFAYNVLFHPVDCMEAIRYNKKRINMAIPFIIFITAYVVRIAYIYIVHYPLASIDLTDANVIFEGVKLFIVPVTWIPASFMVTSISDGETKMKDIFFATSLSLVPYIVINVPLMFISNILSKSQASWYGVFSAACFIWMFIILFLSLWILNGYSFGKTIKSVIIIAFVMLLIWVVVLLCYVLVGRLFQFIGGVYDEFMMSIL
ncbi:MAG: SMP-30/gluconolactonase/LRE family protein [Lachnospiraceae bacterium]|nr:SMP-30/gluconolactonase/LRE family protein [Lachnospiraceae bacterium]